MTTCIQLFCASLFLFYGTLEAGSEVELLFLPGGKAHFSSVTSVFKEIKTNNSNEKSSEFYSHQGVEAYLSVEEPASQEELMPFDFTLTLKKIKLSLKNNDRQISYDSENCPNCLEMSEAKALIDKPLKFTLTDFESPFLIKSEQKKLLEGLSLFNANFAKGLFEEDLKDLFALAGKPLAVGSSFQIVRTIDDSFPLEILKDYKITEITTDRVLAEVKTILMRQKIVKELLTPPFNENQTVTIVASGESLAKMAWNRKNSLLFTLEEIGSYKYSIRTLGFSSLIHFEIEKEVLSSPEEL